MPGVGATTYYDVVTRYRMQDGATSDLNRYTRSTNRADDAVNRLQRRTRGLSRGMRTLALIAGPAMGGMMGLAAVGYGAIKTFRNLNQEINSTIQLAAQVNLAFRFEGAQNAAQNFNLSMGASRKVFRELVRDAARLPGELSDFIGIAKQISGGVFAGGGNLQTMRALTARVALAAPAAGAGFQEAGLGAMQMLFGVARVTNPLFKMLAGQGLLPKAEIFNALTATERLRRLDEALAKLTDNEMFRKNILGTWDTQLGTLADNLFGVQGIMGQLLSGPMGGMLDWLTRLNETLTEKTPGIVEGIRQIVDAINLLGTISTDLVSDWERNYFLRGGLVGMAARNMPEKLGTQLVASTVGWWRGITRFRDPWAEYQRAYTDLRSKHFRRENLRFLEGQEDLAGMLGIGPGAAGFTLRDVPNAKIEQNFHIKLDLKSDDAPDAVALKIEKAMEKVGRHPTTVSRGLSALPHMAGMGP
jgi:hypothetical protein